MDYGNPGRIRSHQGQKLRDSPGRRNNKLEGLKVKISFDTGIQYKGSKGGGGTGTKRTESRPGDWSGREKQQYTYRALKRVSL